MINKKINNLKILNQNVIKKNEFWLYSAGFNFKNSDINLKRLNEEIFDLKLLIKKKAKVFIISHQGDFKKKTAENLRFLIPLLKKKIKTKINYFSKNVYDKSLISERNKLKSGSILIVGNTRLNRGEQLNSKVLAKRYSVLAKKIVIGGFCKSHRKNSSNNAILNYTKGYISNGISRELKIIDNWISIPNKNYILALGGVKREKITIGLNYLSANFKHIIPSGVVLNMILRNKGIEIGKSLYLKDKESNQVINYILKKYSQKIYLPEELIVTNNTYSKIKILNYKELKKNDIIGGYPFCNKLSKIFKKCLKKRGKILLSGTPSMTKNNIIEPTLSISRFMKKQKKLSFVLGGDSTNDLNYSYNASTGGGAALYYIAGKELEIIKKLKKNI